MPKRPATRFWMRLVLLAFSPVALGSFVINAHGSDLHLPASIVQGVEACEFSDAGLRWFANAGDPDALSVDAQAYFHWGAFALPKAECLLLNDGSWIVGQIVYSGNSLRVVSQYITTEPIPTSAVRAIVRKIPVNASRAIELFQSLGNGDENDRVWLEQNQVLSGIVEIETSVDAMWSLRITPSGRKDAIPMPIERPEAISFSSALFDAVDQFQGTLVIGLRDGSRLKIASWKLQTAGTELVLAGGQKLLLTGVRAPPMLRDAESGTKDTGGAICCAFRQPTIEPDGSSQVRLLGELEASSYRQTGQTLIEWPLGKNADCHGRPLQEPLGIVLNGIALHATSRVAYKLETKASQFLATATMAQPVSANHGSPAAPPDRAEIEVLLVRNGKLEKLQSWFLRRTKPDRLRLKCDISGAQLLVIAVRAPAGSPRGEYGAHVQLLNARIAHTPQPPQ